MRFSTKAIIEFLNIVPVVCGRFVTYKWFTMPCLLYLPLDVIKLKTRSVKKLLLFRCEFAAFLLRSTSSHFLHYAYPKFEFSHILKILLNAAKSSSIQESEEPGLRTI